MSNLDDVIATLKAERDRIDKALHALTGHKTKASNTSGSAAKVPNKKAVGLLTKEGKERIAEAQRKRWAAAKKVANKPPTKEGA